MQSRASLFPPESRRFLERLRERFRERRLRLLGDLERLREGFLEHPLRRWRDLERLFRDSFLDLFFIFIIGHNKFVTH